MFRTVGEEEHDLRDGHRAGGPHLDVVELDVGPSGRRKSLRAHKGAGLNSKRRQILCARRGANRGDGIGAGSNARGIRDRDRRAGRDRDNRRLPVTRRARWRSGDGTRWWALGREPVDEHILVVGNVATRVPRGRWVGVLAVRNNALRCRDLGDDGGAVREGRAIPVDVLCDSRILGARHNDNLIRSRLFRNNEGVRRVVPGDGGGDRCRRRSGIGGANNFDRVCWGDLPCIVSCCRYISLSDQTYCGRLLSSYVQDESPLPREWVHIAVVAEDNQLVLSANHLVLLDRAAIT